MIYSTMPHGLYCTFTSMLMFGMGNMMLSIAIGVIIYVLVEHPFSRLIQWTCLSRLSHDKALHSGLMMDQKVDKN